MNVGEAGVDEFFRGSEVLYNALPEGVRVTFELSGPGGGLWTVRREDDGRTIVSLDEVVRPDCRLKCTVDDFIALVEGELNVRRAFLEGRLHVRGDVGLVWRLQKILVARKGA